MGTGRLNPSEKNCSSLKTLREVLEHGLERGYGDMRQETRMGHRLRRSGNFTSWLESFGGNPMNPNSRCPKSLGWIAAVSVLLSFLFVASAFAANPVPYVVAPVSPQAVAPGSGAFALTVYGAGFVSGATVNWNGSPRSTTFISFRELQAQILASDVAKPTAGFITVTNPAPGGGNSSSSYGLVEVHTPTKTIIPKKPQFYPLNGFVWSMVAADFNRDGKLDLMAGADNELDLLLGHGDGTFQDSVISRQYFSTAGMAYGDFNDNGKLDLAFAEGPSDNKPPPMWKYSWERATVISRLDLCSENLVILIWLRAISTEMASLISSLSPVIPSLRFF